MLKRALGLAVLAGILIILPLSLSGVFRDQAVRAASPAVSPLTRISQEVRGWFVNIGDLGRIRREREELQQTVISLQSQLAEQESIRRENDSLRQELGVTGTVKESEKVFARVVLQGNNPLDRTMTLNVGSAQGIKVGQPVVHQGSLVGTIIEVRESSSIARSILSPQSIVQAWVPTLQEKCLLVGDGNTVILRDITQGIDVPSGSLVETSGLGGSLPQGILIGQVGTALTNPSNLSQSFRVNLNFDAGSLESVLVLLTTTSP